MPKKKIETPESVDSGTLLLETSAENVADTAEAPTTPDSPETGALDPTSAPSPEEVTALPKPKRSSRDSTGCFTSGRTARRSKSNGGICCPRKRPSG